MEIDEFKRRFGARVQTLRRQRGMTQEQLAEAIGKSTDTVSNIETGRLSTRIDTALRIAQVLKVNVADLFDTEDERQRYAGESSVAVEEFRAMIAPLDSNIQKKIVEINRQVLLLISGKE